jgi:hypothetical protein
VRERHVGWRQEIGLGPRPENQQGTGEEGRTAGWSRLGEAQQVGALRVGPESGGHAEAESRWRLDAEAREHQPVAQEQQPEPCTVAVAPEPLIGQRKVQFRAYTKRAPIRALFLSANCLDPRDIGRRA